MNRRHLHMQGIRGMTLAGIIAAAAVGWGLIVPAHAQQNTNFTPKVPTGNLTLAAGGTAQAFQVAGAIVGCVIVNPTTATEQGISAAETIWVNLTGTAAAAAGGASIPVE